MEPNVPLKKETVSPHKAEHHLRHTYFMSTRIAYSDAFYINRHLAAEVWNVIPHAGWLWAHPPHTLESLQGLSLTPTYTADLRHKHTHTHTLRFTLVHHTSDVPKSEYVIHMKWIETYFFGYFFYTKLLIIIWGKNHQLHGWHDCASATMFLQIDLYPCGWPQAKNAHFDCNIGLWFHQLVVPLTTHYLKVIVIFCSHPHQVITQQAAGWQLSVPGYHRLLILHLKQTWNIELNRFTLNFSQCSYA